MKSGFIGLFGVPNAGKSSLVNALTGESVSIVTAKPQTTRKRTLGILTKPDSYQMIFVDTPGVIEKELGLNRFLKYEFEKALSDVDVAVFAVAPWEFEQPMPPASLGTENGFWFQKALKQVKDKPTLFIASQSDKKIGVDRLKVWESWWQGESVPSLLLTSSKNKLSLKPLLDELESKLKPGPCFYPSDEFTTQSSRELVQEVVRKHAFERLHQEVPYGLACLVRQFEEGPINKIYVDLVVQRESHKNMVIGTKGQTLKSIGTLSRLELERMLGQKIFLKLHVTAKPWLKDPIFLSELGFTQAQEGTP